MHEAFRKLIIALVNFWLIHDEMVARSIHYVRREDLDADDPFEDGRLAGGKIVRVTIEIADDDSKSKA